MRSLKQDEYNEIINYELAFVGLTVKDVEGIDNWFHNNTMTNAQYEQWRDWTVEYLIKKCKVSRKEAEKWFRWININHGLRISDDPKS
ncbi:MAG: hypothetical protein PHS33_08430 [Candidatus Omnitrophica bacterium]|nr:hypothetical protein [Candidatus Omnitrophota bacterium]